MRSMDKPRIAIDTTYMDRRPGMGTAIVIRRTVEEMRRYRDQFDITLVHREAIPEDPLYLEFNEIVIPRVRLPKFSGFFSELFFFLTTRERFDVYYFSYSKIYPTFWLAPARSIVFAAMDGGPQTAGYMQKAKGKVAWHTKIFFRFVDRFVAISEFGKRGICSTYGIRPDRVTVVYNGVDSLLRPIATDARTVQSLQIKYDLPERYILDVSRFDPHKNILGVVRAYASLIKQCDRVEDLVFVGGRHIPAYSSAVDAEISSLGIADRVHIAPFISDEDMVHVYNNASLMVFPSFYEGFGLPVIEAQACGVPVVISNIEALTEVSGGAALTVDPYDVTAIAKAMHELLANEDVRTRLVHAGKRNAARFTWQAHGDTIAQIFMQLSRTT
jgi:glycosyltransferase involved in cell wall biosynthesis